MEALLELTPVLKFVQHFSTRNTVVLGLMKITHLFSYLPDSKNQKIIDKVLSANDRGNYVKQFRFKLSELLIWINLDSSSEARNQS